jgi:hypothetical protein
MGSEVNGLERGLAAGPFGGGTQDIEAGPKKKRIRSGPDDTLGATFRLPRAPACQDSRIECRRLHPFP